MAFYIFAHDRKKMLRKDVIQTIYPYLAERYEVTISTANMIYAGTDALVKFTMYGDTNTCGPYLIGTTFEEFESNG